MVVLLGVGQGNPYQTPSPEIPIDFRLSYAYPNPFNPVTNIQVTSTQTCIANINILSISNGNIIKSYSKTVVSGIHVQQINLGFASSGIYLYIMECNGRVQYRTMTLIK